MIQWGDMHEDFGKMNEAWKDVEKDEQSTMGVTFDGCRGGEVEDAGGGVERVRGEMGLKVWRQMLIFYLIIY